MKVLLDTNIIMDALQERAHFAAEAKEILTRAQGGKDFICLFTANAAADIFYLYSRARDTRSAKAALSFLIKIFGIVSVTQDDCSAALKLPIEDFEDALALVCAEKTGADYIITRDDDFLRTGSPCKLISPGDFLAMHPQINVK